MPTLQLSEHTCNVSNNFTFNLTLLVLKAGTMQILVNNWDLGQKKIIHPNKNDLTFDIHYCTH